MTLSLAACLTALLAAMSIACPAPCAAGPADLDASWGEDGVAFSGSLLLDDIVFSADGSLFAFVSRGVGGEIAKFDARGRIDTAFANERYLHPARISQLGGGTATSFALMQDGRYVTLHTNLDAFPSVPQYIARYLPDGRPDPTFGPNGVVRIDPVEDRSGSLALLTLARDGRHYFVRSTVHFNFVEPPYVQFDSTSIVRTDAAGGVEAEFGRFGETSPGSRVLQASYKALAVQNDGKLVAAVATAESGLVVMRFGASGTPDPAFGTNGVATARTAGPLSTEAMVLLPDDNVVAVGRGESAGRRTIVVARFNADGVLDTAFGDNGLAVVPVAPASDTIERAFVARLNDGSLVIAAAVRGQLDALQRQRFHSAVVIRLHPDGRVDDRFSGAGKATVWTRGGFMATALDVRPGGQIVLAGTSTYEFDPFPAQRGVVLQLRGGQDSVSRPLAESHAVEYFHRGFLHFFITADPHEIAMMDVTPSAWVRTGDTIRVWSEPHADLAPTCRFWSDQAFAPRSSHFYTPYAGECSSLRNGSAVWKYEGDAFYLRMPDDAAHASICPAGTQPLYRAYNNGLTGAPNHRYVTGSAVLDAMIGLGYVFEGAGQTRIFACVPLQ